MGSPRRDRKHQYVQTGERIGGFLGGVIAFFAPLASIIPKVWWGAIFSAVVAIAGFGGGRATAPEASADMRVDALVVAVDSLTSNVRVLATTVDSTNRKMGNKLDNLTGAFFQLPGALRAMDRAKRLRDAQDGLGDRSASIPTRHSGFAADAAPVPDVAGPNWRPSSLQGRR